MTTPLDVAELLGELSKSQVDYVLIGGLAVNAYGVIRSTKDVDICPAPDSTNLTRLAEMPRRIGATQLGVSDNGFAEDELPFDPTRVDDLARGGNFRLDTPLGALDIMQWIPGIDADQAYSTLASGARTADAFGLRIKGVLARGSFGDETSCRAAPGPTGI
ncbi:MAG: hypothetical protein ACYDHH_23120 [Solirubrobacteraceae bacterium]